MMIEMLYTLLPLEKFNNERHSTIGEIEARKERIWVDEEEETRWERENAKELDICLIK